jgi:hypothetical protein
MKVDRKARRIARGIKRFNQKLIRKFKLDVFFNDAHKTEPKNPVDKNGNYIDPTLSNKERLLAGRIKSGRLGKVKR